MTDAAAKSDLRRAVRARRAGRPESEREAAGAALASHAGLIDARTVAAFVGGRGEPPTLPLLGALVDRGVRVLLPLLREDMDLEWAELGSPDDLRPGPRGILQPGGPSLGLEAVGAAELVLAPALAVDREGRRLGQGGGSYDRALGRTDAPVTAIVFDDELLEAEDVPVEDHDRRVDAALTPGRGVVWLRGPGA